MSGIRQRLKGILRPGGYDPGDKVAARVKDINGHEREAEFEIERYCGGGFAGQVYRARVKKCEDNWLATGQVFALKFFSTRSGFRRMFRDLMYFLAFQSPFPHQYNEPAVRTGLFMTKLLRWVSQVEFGSEGPINDCYGTFWNEHIKAYAEVNEWVEGRVTDAEVDSTIFTRYFHNRMVNSARRRGDTSCELLHSGSEIAKKKAFMGSLVKLCADLGIEDLARQIYWWTGMSQANIFTRNSASGTAEFVWVDRRPGLPGFLLSLGDIPLLAKAILRGSIPPFDKVNFKKLRSWPKAPNREEWEATVDQLQSIDTQYRRSQIDVLGHHINLLISRKLRKDIAESVVDYWWRTGRIDSVSREKLCNSGLRMVPHLLLSWVPFFGVRLQKLWGNADYRAHVSRMLSDRKYRWDYMDHRRKTGLAMWLKDGRISDGRAEKCLQSLPAYLRDRFCSFWVIGIPFLIVLPKLMSLLAWPLWVFIVTYLVVCSAFKLPASWQRFFTDVAHATSQLKKAVASSFKYVFAIPYRRKVNVDWVRERTEDDVRHGYVTRDEAETFNSIAGAEAMQQYVTGIMVTLALQPASEIVLLSLAAGFGMSWLHDVTSFHSLWTKLWQLMGNLGWWAPPLIILFCAVSPAGILRFTFCTTQWIRNRHVPYGTATSLAIFRAIGDLAFMVQIAKTYPQFSGYLLTSSICHLVGMVPVFGERGGLLNIWVATVLLSWPASFKAWRHERADLKQQC